MQEENQVPVMIGYDKPIWSGLSWAVGEIDLDALPNLHPLNIRCVSHEKKELRMHLALFHVEYA